MLGLSHKTLATWRCRTTRGPRYIKLGRAVRYRVGELRRWIAAKGTRSHTNSPPQDLGAA
jgi:predicted DNA-binding transcriptional regulator AlpA